MNVLNMLKYLELSSNNNFLCAYRSGRHKTELDLLVVRQQQLRWVKDCIALAGEYVTTQHKPIVFEIRMKKWKEKRTMGPKNIK